MRTHSLRRLYILLLTLALAPALGCSGGISEGPPAEGGDVAVQPQGYEEMQKMQGDEMLKGAQ